MLLFAMLLAAGCEHADPLDPNRLARNSVGLTTDHYLRGGDLDIAEFFNGDFRIGFNIFRVLNF